MTEDKNEDNVTIKKIKRRGDDDFEHLVQLDFFVETVFQRARQQQQFSHCCA